MSGQLPFYFRTNHKPLLVIFEPTCEEIVLAINTNLELIIEFPELERLETYLTEKTLTIHLWTRCRAKLLIDNVDRTPPALLKPCPPY